MIADIFVFLIIFLFGFTTADQFKKHLKPEEVKHLKWLWPYHLVFGIYYCFFIAGDARGYWRNAASLTGDTFWQFLLQTQGTDFVTAINYFPASVLGLSYFSGTLLYTLIGYLGIALFYVLAIRLVPYNSYFMGVLLFPLIFFWPNLHFWSVAVGKDTLVFVSIAAFLFGVVQRKYFVIVASLFFCYLIRPHITIMLLAAFGAVVLLSSNLSVSRKIIVFSFLFAVSLYILPFVVTYVKLGEFSLEAIQSTAENKAALLSREGTGSRVDISSYPLPFKLFTFVYRPLFFDINGIPALIASIENFILLILSIKLFFSSPIRSFRAAPLVIKGLVVFFLIGTLLFAHSLGNLGVMIRMRNMFLPGFLIFMLWTFSYAQYLQAQHLPSR